MLFSLVATVLAVTPVIPTWPCQRLNWAWRNVWVTCSVNAFTPVSATPVGSIPAFFQAVHTAPLSSSPGWPMLDGNGVFTPTGFGPNLCAFSPNTGANAARNRCRRMLDTYGQLLGLCQMGPAKSMAGPNQGSPDWGPQNGHVPHTSNIKMLTQVSQICLYGSGATFPIPSNTCPGLAGWFNVVWNACQFSNAPGVTTTALAPGGIPSYLTPAVQAGFGPNSPAYQLVTPGYLCGSVAAPGTAVSPSIWNIKGTTFRSSRCRKSLDAFGRAGIRCVAPPQVPVGVAPNAQVVVPSDSLHFLALNLASQSPFCNS